jgi:polyferredoxin
LTTHKLYAGLLWAAATIALTIILGRFFCGWVCPFGALHQFVGWLGRQNRKHGERVDMNQYSRWQSLKYYLLTAMLLAAAAGFLLTGWLDPIPLMHRSVNLFLLAFWDGGGATRVYAGAWLIAAVFIVAVLLNFWVPRFYCRFICPLGALFGAVARWTPWRIGKRAAKCNECELCETSCEGACQPFEKIRVSECLLCMNCLRACRQAQMTYSPQRSAAGEVLSPEVTRRGFVAAAIAGVATAPALRLGGLLSQNWNPAVVRPPGALAEEKFLERCVKCGQCMRVCPTNVVQPALLEGGLAAIWTPLMNFRAGTSGCQVNCVACGNVCPTSAIRPLSLDEKLGRNSFAPNGPVRLGTAFVDRGRCLPWAMDVPCIVCQENCPVSPKAIQLREEYHAIRDGARAIRSATRTSLTLDAGSWPAGNLATGDYFVRLETAHGNERQLITENSGNVVGIPQSAEWRDPPVAGTPVVIEVRLQQPVVEPEQCIGCGICEHECPVSGWRAIRVTAENETRNQRHSLTAKA